MTCANHPDRERTAFCQNCGKPLCQECMRSVGSAVYCEPCLALRLNAASAPSAATPGAYTFTDPLSGVQASGTAAGGTYSYRDPVTGVYAAGVIPPGASAGSPNPLLAGLLGFIPGVGAMYNEQYAKGIVHLIVFAVLVSLADSNGIFGLFVAGWEFYMAIEAYHTARARRDGQILPNPFGLNDLGEKLGFGKAWHTGQASAAAPPVDPYSVPYTPPSTAYTATVNPAAPADASGAAPVIATPYAAGSGQPAWENPATSQWQQYAPQYQQYIPSYQPVPPVRLDDHIPYPGNRFPAGALWLIGFGVLFLVTNAGIFHGFSSRLFLPVFLIGLAVFVFVRKMTSSGAGLSGDGSAGYRLRVFRALRGSAWIALVGLLFFLDEFHILSWGHSWPLFIILAGVMTVFERGAYSAAAAAAPAYGPGYGYAAPVPPPPVAAEQPPATAMTPVSPRDQEGS